MNADVTQLSAWNARDKRRRTLSLLIVLLVALGSVACGLSQLARDLDARLLLITAAIGGLVGWVLALTRLRGWLAGVLASLVGAGVISVRVGQLGGELAAVLRAFLAWPWVALRWLFGGEPPGWAPLLAALAELRTDASALLARGGYWLLTLVGGHSAYDPLAVTLMCGLAIWLAAIWAGWRVCRHQPLRGLTPASALLVVTLYFTDAKPFSALPLLTALLLLMALVEQDDRECRWQEARVDFSRDMWRSLAVRAASLSLALVVVATLLPFISAQRIADEVRRLTERGERTDSSEPLESGVQHEGGTDVFGGVRVIGLPRRHLIGLEPELSRRVVMTIHTGDMLAGLSEPAQRYYWRGATYDLYDGHGWSTSRTDSISYRAGEWAIEGGAPYQRLVQQEVHVFGGLERVLHIAGTLLTVDQGYRVAWRSPGDAFGALTAADVYRADSLLPVVGEAQLRAAGRDYPDWVRERYLALPDTVPARVFSLARDLTQAAPSPYDGARAIEAYLRTFTYTLDVPLPPLDQDVADYFLFDLRQGYCDYYATAMVVLARAAGLPARLVVGYATGRYDAANLRYVVTEANAHSWAEVYFPPYGWEEFEPTAGRAAIRRTDPSASGEEPAPGGALAAAEGRRIHWTWWLGLLGGPSLLALAGLFWLVAEAWWLRRLAPAAALARLYRWLRRRGQRMGVPMRVGDTPYEFAASFAAWVAEMAQSRRWGGLLAPAAQEACGVIDLYVQASYGDRLPDSTDRAQAVRMWRRLRRRLWLAQSGACVRP